MSWLGELSDFGPAPLAVDIYWESYPGKKAHIWRLWQQSGWMQAVRVSLETPISTHEEIITLFCNDMGQPMPTWLGNRLFDMRSSIPTYMHHEPPEELEDQADGLYWDFLGRCDRKNLAELARGEDTLFEDIARTEGKALAGVSDIDSHITTLRRERRHPECCEDRRAQIDAQIDAIAQLKPKLLAALPGEVAKLHEAYELFEDDVYESVTCHGRIDPLYTVRWTMQSRHTPPPINVSLWTEERFMGNLNVGTRWKEQMRSVYDGSQKNSVSNVERRSKSVEPINKRKTIHATVKASVASMIADKQKRKLFSKPKQVDVPPSISKNAAWAHTLQKRRKRAKRQELILILQKHGTIAELKHVRAFLKGKTGPDLKLALIHLAKQDFMSVDDAVYLYKALSALNSNTTKRD